MTSVIMVGKMLPILLVLAVITVADINIDINISGEEEAAVRGTENSEGRNTTSTVLNNNNNNLREVAEDCSEKKVWTDFTLSGVSLFPPCLGWAGKAFGVRRAE